MLRSPQSKDIKINKILGPFTIQIWYAMIVYFISSLMCLCLLFRYENTSLNERRIIRYSNCFLVVAGALCQQSK